MPETRAGAAAWHYSFIPLFIHASQPDPVPARTDKTDETPPDVRPLRHTLRVRRKAETRLGTYACVRGDPFAGWSLTSARRWGNGRERVIGVTGSVIKYASLRIPLPRPPPSE